MHSAGLLYSVNTFVEHHLLSASELIHKQKDSLLKHAGETNLTLILRFVLEAEKMYKVEVSLTSPKKTKQK